MPPSQPPGESTRPPNRAPNDPGRVGTSVLVSAVISAQGPNAQLFDFITAGQIMPCVSDVLIDEYHRVFSYRHLQHLDANRVAKLRGLLEAGSIRVQPRHRLEISGHDDDNRVYECAEAAGADYIVTENTKHFKSPTRKRRSSTPGNC